MEALATHSWVEITPEAVTRAEEVVARSEMGYVPLRNRNDLPPKVAKVLSAHGPGRPWSEEDARVVAAFVGFAPECPWPGSGNAPWSGRCVQAGHQTAPMLASLLQGQGCCVLCGRSRTAEGKVMRNLLRSMALAEERDMKVVAYGRKRLTNGTDHLMLRVLRPDCGHLSEIRASQLKLNAGCGVCHGLQVLVGVNDLGTTHPELASQLVDPGLAQAVTFSSNRKIRWRCQSCRHEWMAAPNSRTNMGSGCPRCSPRGYDLSRPGALYVVAGASITTGELLVKVGISNEDRLPERLQRHERQGLHNVIAVLRWRDGLAALTVEQRWKGPQGLRSGLAAHSRPRKVDLPDGHTEAVIDSDEARAAIGALLKFAHAYSPETLTEAFLGDSPSD